jgi:hypothetical protein
MLFFACSYHAIETMCAGPLGEVKKQHIRLAPPPVKKNYF